MAKTLLGTETKLKSLTYLVKFRMPRKTHGQLNFCQENFLLATKAFMFKVKRRERAPLFFSTVEVRTKNGSTFSVTDV